MKKVFFDTEFTGLHKNTTLISIGLITEDDKTFYAEFKDFDKKVFSDNWILNNVIKYTEYINDAYSINRNYEYIQDKYIFGNNFTKCFGNKEFVKDKLIIFLNSIRENDDIQLISDVCHYDMTLFIDIFGSAFDLPSWISPVCYDINQDIAKHYNITNLEAFDKNRESIIYNNKIFIDGNKHNSLFDAKVIKEIYNLINKGGN